jgi:hypothetical protein
MFGHIDNTWHALTVDSDGVWRTQCDRYVLLAVIDDAVPVLPTGAPRCRACGRTQSAATTKPPATRIPKVAESGRCKDCLAPGTRGKYGGFCGLCALRHGFVSCGKCRNPFKPTSTLPRNTAKFRCPKCAKKKQARGSVWTVAGAGSPGLGRRA